MMVIAQQQIFALYNNAIQEIDRLQQSDKAKIVELETKNSALETEVGTLETEVGTLKTELAAIKAHLGL